MIFIQINKKGKIIIKVSKNLKLAEKRRPINEIIHINTIKKFAEKKKLSMRVFVSYAKK